MFRIALLFIAFSISLLSIADEADPWSHQLTLLESPLLSERQSYGEKNRIYLQWAKFTLLQTDRKNTLYFQDSKRFPFHYDFARQHLSIFEGLSPSEFDRLTLYNDHRIALMGNVLLLRDSNGNAFAYAIQLVAQDTIRREEVARVYHLVDEQIEKSEPIPGYYIPTYEQEESARQNRDWLAEQEIEVTSLSRWVDPIAVYAPGWAMGLLVELEPDEIETAYAEGALLPTDILLTSQVPAEIPFVAGILSREPGTPNSHVAILATSWGVPYAYRQTEPDYWEDLIGEEVIFITSRYGFSMTPVPTDLTPEIREEILSLKRPPVLDLPPMEAAGTYTLDIEELSPEDIVHVGGKAAHYSLLRDAIPANSRPAIALTFDLWNDFLDQELPGRGHTLRAEINSRLGAFASYPPDFADLSHQLDEIRDIIKDETIFTEAQEVLIIEALSIFNPDEKIRFRSSTNVEDSEDFTGAGLYDSYSGCLLDDLDNDDEGPSACEADEAKEKGVFWAIRKVYASFYNDNAFLERLRHGVDESKVGMAVLVHHSFPDEIEMANGVAILEHPRSDNHYHLEVTSQAGAVSITNPDGGAIPEQATVYRALEMVLLNQRSNLLRLGEEFVLGEEAAYLQLFDLLVEIQKRYAQLYPELDARSLEFEFKKVAPEGILIIKQVRPMPPEPERPEKRYLLAGEISLEPFQGEQANVFSIHRAKSRFDLSFGIQRLHALQSGQSPVAYMAYSRPVDGEIVTWNPPHSNWPGARHSLYTDSNNHNPYSSEAWTEIIAGKEVTRSLEFVVPDPSSSPFVFVDSLRFRLRTDYPLHPEPWDTYPGYDPNFDPSKPVSEFVSLTSTQDRTQPGANAHLVSRQVSHIGLGARIEFYWPFKDENLIYIGYTAPLEAWKQTTITGLTSEPLVLTDPWAQTYRPGHHNIGERFLFEPRLDPSVPQSIIDELNANGIEIIMTEWGSSSGQFLYGPHDGPLTDPTENWFGPLERSWSGQYVSPWLGTFSTEYFPDINHETLGWIQVAGNGPRNLFFWDYSTTLGWIWTSQSLFPFFYHLEADAWLYYWPASTNPTWWYHYGTETWMSHP